MQPKSWHLTRRSFLRGAGVCITLPYMQAMEMDAAKNQQAKAKRACFVYWPNGCSMPAEDDPEYSHWRWFPKGEGRDFKFTRILESLEPYREDIALYSGLSHPKSRELLGHLAGDTWLTAGDLRGGHYKNNISLDQLIARHFKQYTRYPSFVLSTDGGVGYKSRVSTLSFDDQGRPIPSEHRHREIFERYFGGNGGQTTEERRRSIQEGKKVVDLVMEDTRLLAARLGAEDKHKLDEYLTSLNSVEEQIQRNEAWLDTPLKPFNADHLKLDPNPKIDPTAYVRTMYDLMVLGFQTDATRVMTYMLAREDGMGFGDNWPRIVAGVNKGHHTISHDTHKGHFDEWGPFDRWFAEQFAYFVGRLKETSDEHGSLLDNTMVLYGSSCTTTHNARNYPLCIAGGKNMGLRQGYFARYSKSAMVESNNNPLTGALLNESKRVYKEDDLPCSNLYLGMLHALGIKAESFGDSTEVLPGFFA
ncbi:MAG: hypothetical protein ACI8QC_004328 [Planctomycetota bacterium]|jgi:hypothetical protein